MLFKKKKDVTQVECEVVQVKKKKKSSLSKALAFSLAMSVCAAMPVMTASAEGTSLSVTDDLTTMTSTITSLWTFITGNPYLSFSVSVSIVLAVIMIFKRLIGAVRR